MAVQDLKVHEIEVVSGAGLNADECYRPWHLVLGVLLELQQERCGGLARRSILE